MMMDRAVSPGQERKLLPVGRKLVGLAFRPLRHDSDSQWPPHVGESVPLPCEEVVFITRPMRERERSEIYEVYTSAMTEPFLVIVEHDLP